MATLYETFNFSLTFKIVLESYYKRQIYVRAVLTIA